MKTVGIYVEKCRRQKNIDIPCKRMQLKKPLIAEQENTLIAANQRIKKEMGYLCTENACLKIMRLRSEESSAEKQKIIAISKLKRKLKLYTLLICPNIDTYYGTDIKGSSHQKYIKSFFRQGAMPYHL